jgi:4-hydroxybenzoate polyprenyltransferase
VINTLRQLLRTMRPGQWVKNLFVFAPAVFAKAHSTEDPWILLDAALGTVVFILLAGSVYVMNDVLDVEKDREHPVKKSRPLASGLLSVQDAVAGGLFALAAALGLGFLLGTAFSLVATGYLALNVAYSTFLKRIAWLDVLSIATGFLLRILAGSYAAGLRADEISSYLVLCTFLVALFLALGKRRHELALLGDESARHRSVLRQYDLRHLDWALWLVAALTAFSYAAYTVSPHTREYFGTSRLMWSAPLVFAGIGRFLFLLRRKGEARSPTDVMIRDLAFTGIILAWGMVVTWAIYG